VERVMSAMMQMVKLDVAKPHAAAKGWARQRWRVSAGGEFQSSWRPSS
jgi:hypothetical protein